MVIRFKSGAAARALQKLAEFRDSRLRASVMECARRCAALAVEFLRSTIWWIWQESTTMTKTRILNVAEKIATIGQVVAYLKSRGK